MEIRTKQITKKELGTFGQEVFTDFEDFDTVGVEVTFIKGNEEINSGIIFAKDVTPGIVKKPLTEDVTFSVVTTRTTGYKMRVPVGLDDDELYEYIDEHKYDDDVEETFYEDDNAEIDESSIEKELN